MIGQFQFGNATFIKGWLKKKPYGGEGGTCTYAETYLYGGGGLLHLAFKSR
jgi:hypothetical protein